MSAYIRIDQERSSQRIERDVETLAQRAYTLADDAICRYAFTEEYKNTIGYFRQAFDELGFLVYEDPVGNLVARNRPPGEPVVGIGSHCDSNRNGGKYDGTMGVVAALEVGRLDREMGLDLPLQCISFLEEEGSGFGEVLLGSRIAAREVDEGALREAIRSLDDGRTFWSHAKEAGYQPQNWRDSRLILQDLIGWLEMHIEQGTVLEESGHQIGVVDVISGYSHKDVVVRGRSDHAGATPMHQRSDAGALAAAAVAMLRDYATRKSAETPTVATVGEMKLEPGLINVVPGYACFSVDLRSTSQRVVGDGMESLRGFLAKESRDRNVGFEVEARHEVAPVAMAPGVREHLERAAEQGGISWRRLHSGAAHDTMCVAGQVPSGMVFVPCKDGISHAPEESAKPADAAVAAELLLNTVAGLVSGRSQGLR